MGLREYTALYIIIQTGPGRIHSIFSEHFTVMIKVASAPVLPGMLHGSFFQKKIHRVMDRQQRKTQENPKTAWLVDPMSSLLETEVYLGSQWPQKARDGAL